MNKKKLNLFIITTIIIILAGCGGVSENTDNSGFYIPQGYSQVLTEKELTEVKPLPYFQAPFITIAKNNNNEQFAVVFQNEENYKVVILPVSIDEIVNILASKGFNISTTNVNYNNLHLFEINNNLVWNYEEKTKIYLDLNGKEVDPFKKI